MADAPDSGNRPRRENALPGKTRLHEYRIESCLGQGGFGFTYLGFDIEIEQLVAVKEYFPDGLAERMPDATVRAVPGEEAALRGGTDGFIDEARLIARVHHRNVAEVRRFFRLNGTAYMVLRYEEGPTLAEAIAGGAMPEPRLRRILDGILDGLEALHERAILHRDAKPSNIILSRNRSEDDPEIPVLVDFGAARDFSRPGADRPAAVGAPGYAPPEQYRSDLEQGPWTDLYAVGATAYACITGHAPLDCMRRLRGEPFVPASAAGRGTYDPDFLALVDRLLDPDDARRPQSAAQVREALAALPPAGTIVRPPPAPEPPDMTTAAAVAITRRHRPLAGLLLLTGLFCLLLAGAGTAAYLQRGPLLELACDRANLLCTPADLAFREVVDCMGQATACGPLACGIGYAGRFPDSRHLAELEGRMAAAVGACLPPPATAAGDACPPAPPAGTSTEMETPTARLLLAGTGAWSAAIADGGASPSSLAALGHILRGLSREVAGAEDQGFEAIYAAAFRGDAAALLWMAEAYDPTRPEGTRQPGIQPDAGLALDYYRRLAPACARQSQSGIEAVCGWARDNRRTGDAAALHAYTTNCTGG